LPAALAVRNLLPMSHASTSEFLDGLKTSRLLDDERIEELRARPEAVWGDVISLANYAQDRGWLTAYQAQELREGRGNQLAVGGYRIFDKLADGPFGVTYKALHPALQQPVSLRLLRPDWLAPADTPADYVERTHAATLVQNPHVATVLDIGTHGGTPYVVQELVDGCDLFHMVNEMGALPVGLACEYTRQAALALKAAHDRGVAHGQVTPRSLLLTPVKRATGSNGDVSVRPRAGATIKLAELGLSPRRPPVGDLSFGQSDRLGPVAFYPPERLTNGDRTPAGDLYGLGATLYYLLTARPPHTGPSPVDVLLNLQQAEPPPLESLRSDVSPAVAVLVRQLLSRDPALRPSAGQVIDTLLPLCEQSAMPGVMTPDPPVLLATETFTQPNVPTAIPVARDLERPVPELSDPVAEAILESPAVLADPVHEPLVEPMSDRTLAEHAKAQGEPSDDHLGAFGHSAMGADTPRAPRPRAQASGKNKAMIITGLLLHLTATILCLGFFGIIPNPFATKPTQPEQPIKKEKEKEKEKKNKRP
jgi:eukaryotic-like serine/threonine-protein kinase